MQPQQHNLHRQVMSPSSTDAQASHLLEGEVAGPLYGAMGQRQPPARELAPLVNGIGQGQVQLEKRRLRLSLAWDPDLLPRARNWGSGFARYKRFGYRGPGDFGYGIAAGQWRCG